MSGGERDPRGRARDSENQAPRDRASVDRNMERQRRAKRGKTGSCCVRGGHGGSYLVPRVDVSTICDEYLCGLRVTILAGPVERCELVLAQAGVEYDAEGWP